MPSPIKNLLHWLKLKMHRPITWSFSENIAKSKLVKSSYIWLFITPLISKTLSELEKIIHLKFLGWEFKITTSLPFSWELLFYSALIFTIANLLYQAKCPEILKKYSNYDSFKKAGGSLLELHKEMKKIVMQDPLAFKKDYKLIGEEYLNNYAHYKAHCSNGSAQGYTPILKAWGDTDNRGSEVLVSEAFYTVQITAQVFRPSWIFITTIIYLLGLIPIILIAYQNIKYVLIHTNIPLFFSL